MITAEDERAWLEQLRNPTGKMAKLNTEMATMLKTKSQLANSRREPRQ